METEMDDLEKRLIQDGHEYRNIEKATS